MQRHGNAVYIHKMTHYRVTQLVDTLCNSILSLCWCI